MAGAIYPKVIGATRRKTGATVAVSGFCASMGLAIAADGEWSAGAIMIGLAAFLAWAINRVPSGTLALVDKPSKPRKSRLRIPGPAICVEGEEPPVDEGEAIWFEYVDYHGEITDRHVINWRFDGEYILGYCMKRRATRKFRRDNVLRWKDWS